MPERTDVAKALRRLRLEHELTQDDVAKVLGIQRATYARYERNRDPEMPVVIRLAAFYSVSFDEILGSARDRILSSSVTLCSPNPDDEKLRMWEPGELSKDEKRLLQLFRFCKRKKLIVDAARKIVAEDMLIDEMVEGLDSES